MNVVADESVERPIVLRLRADEHQVLYVAEFDPSISDDEVLNRANEHEAVLLTGDKDFGELVYRQGLAHGGVVLLRLAGLSNEGKAEIVSAAFRQHGASFVHAFSVISPGVVRIRRA